jgi:group I intron endonuclease
MFTNISGIYAITAPSGNQYIGSAVNIARRWKRHLSDIRNGAHPNPKLVRAFAKYGSAMRFSVIIVCERSKTALLMYEQIAMDALKPTYNLSPTAGSVMGIRYPKEIYASRAAAAKLRRASAETRALIGAASAARKYSKESCAKKSKSLRETMAKPEVKSRMIAAAYRRASNPDLKANISKTLKGRKKPPRSETHRANLGERRLGCRWINDGNSNALLRKGEQLAPGWVYGRINFIASEALITANASRTPEERSAMARNAGLASAAKRRQRALQNQPLNVT